MTCSRKDFKPAIGKYSLFKLVSIAIFRSTSVTTGSTQGFPSSVLKAPTPRLTFFGFVSASQSDLSLKKRQAGLSLPGGKLKEQICRELCLQLL